MKAMNSSVTWASATSVMSSFFAGDQRQEEIEGAFKNRERDREKVKLPLDLETVRPRRHGQ